VLILLVVLIVWFIPDVLEKPPLEFDLFIRPS